MPGGAGAGAAAGTQSEETRRLQALFHHRRSLPLSRCRDAALASTKGPRCGRAAFPGTRQGAGGTGTGGCPPTPPLCLGTHSPPRVPAQRGGAGRGLCGAGPPALWPSPAHAAFPVPALASTLPATGVPAADGDGKGGTQLLVVLPVPPTGVPLPAAPGAARARLTRAPAGMPPRGVPAAEQQRSPQPV